MKLRFSDHALSQLKLRNLSTQLIRSVLKSPDTTQHQTNNRRRALKRHEIDGRVYLLVVIYDQLPNEQVVVTAFRTSKLEKYQ